MFKKISVIAFSIAFCISATAMAGDGERKAVDKQKLLVLVNEARAKGCNCGDKHFDAAGPVSWNDKLEIAAREHTDYMKRQNNLSHTGKNGSRAGGRINDAGYKWREYGENIAAGYKTEEEVINGWLKSPSHCKNLMKAAMKHMAVARNDNYWTQVLATGE